MAVSGQIQKLIVGLSAEDDRVLEVARATWNVEEVEFLPHQNQDMEPVK